MKRRIHLLSIRGASEDLAIVNIDVARLVSDLTARHELLILCDLCSVIKSLSLSNADEDILPERLLSGVYEQA